MIKAVVDVEVGVMAVGGELHADEEWLEFYSMINIRPSQGNRSRSVGDPEIQGRIRAVVARLVRADG